MGGGSRGRSDVRRFRWVHVGLGAVLAAAAAGAWFLARSPAAGPEGLDAGTTEDGEAPGEGPGLAGSEGAARKAPEPVALRPRSAFVGTVTRGGAPAAARIEAYDLQRVEPGVPLSWGANRLADVIVEAKVLSRRPYAGAASAADGRYVLEGIEVGTYEVVAIAEDGARASAKAVAATPGSRTERDLVISDGKEVLRGRAIRGDATPWSGTILLHRAGSDDGTVFGLPRAVAGADGRFEFRGLAPGRVRVTAIEEGRLAFTSEPVAVPFAGEWTFVVDPGATFLAGTVVADADGRPLPGAEATLRASLGPDRTLVVRAPTDDEGRFRIPSPPASWSNLTVRAEGFLPQTTFLQAGETTIRVRLARPSRVSGVVTSPEGTPVGGVAVFATAGRYGVPPSRAVTDDSGRYEIADAAAGDAMLFAYGGGWVSPGLLDARRDGYNPVSVTIPPEGALRADLAVVRAARATGKVLDPSGAGVASAAVVPYPVRGLGVGGWLAEVASAATGADGSFSMDTLVPGADYRFAATAAGWPEGRAGPLHADPAAPLAVEIRLPEARFVDVTVLESGTDAPIAGATVEANFRSSEDNWVSTETTTGSDGRARAGPLTSAAATLSASADGFTSPAGQGIPAASDAPPSPLTFRLSRALAIAGRVRFGDGTPAIQGVYLEVTGNGANEGTWAQAGGQFRIDDLQPGSYEVRARMGWANDAPTAVVSARAGEEDVSLVLSGAALAPCVLRVLDPDGRPVAAAMVAYAGTVQGNSTVEVRDGRALVPPFVQEGWLMVYRARTGAGGPLPFGAVTEGPIPPRTTDLEIRMPPERRIEGVVRGPDGRPVRGALVTARVVKLPGPIWMPGALASARTDEGGAFGLGGLGEGEHQVDVAPPPEFPPAAPVFAAAGTTGLEIVLGTGAVVTLTVLDADGKPVPAAQVNVMPRQTGGGSRVARNASTDESGIARLQGVDAAGKVRVWVNPPDSRNDVLRWHSEDWAPKDETIRLARAFSIRGTVRDRDGRSVGDAELWVASVVRKDYEEWTNSAADGTFDVPGFPAGDVVLRASAGEDDRHVESDLVVVPAGARDVVVLVDEGVPLLVRIEGWAAGRRNNDALFLPEGLDRFSVLVPEGLDHFPTTDAGVGDDGRVKFESARPGARYTLWMPPGPDGRHVYERGLEPGRPERVVRLTEGKTISGRVRLPSRRVGASVGIHDRGISIAGTVDDDGRFEIRGVPDGTWTVTAGVSLPAGEYRRVTATVEAGGTVDLDLTGG